MIAVWESDISATFFDTFLQSNEEKGQTMILDSAWQNWCLVGQHFERGHARLDINGWIVWGVSFGCHFRVYLSVRTYELLYSNSLPRSTEYKTFIK